MFFNRKLNPDEQSLWDATLDAHAKSTYRSNFSTETVIRASISSGNFVQGVAAAVSTLGGEHAPLLQTYDLLKSSDPEREARKLLDFGKKVPGWGNSFEKGHEDPLWLDVDNKLRVMAPTIMQDADLITSVLYALGKPVFPNPSFYTAAVGIRLKVPRGLTPAIFLLGRLGSWSDLVEQNTEKIWEQP